MKSQVRDALTLTNLSDVLALPDPEAASALNERMAIWQRIDKLNERSYAERGIIAREFERRKLWQHLIDPETDRYFPDFSAWACSNVLACRRIIFESKRDMELLRDVPARKLLDVPKENIKVLTKLSTAVRNQPDVLEAARTLPREAFEQKVEKEHPSQHLEARRPMRFSPDKSGAKVVEEAIAWALDHDVAGTRDEALVRMAETALEAWRA